MRTILVIPCLLVALAWSPASAGPRQPDQPAAGPGGAEYPHAAVLASRHGKAEHEFWIFEPGEPRPAGPAPVVVFCHGWGAMSPNVYGGWIEHLVRRGNVVVFPRYQRDFATASIFFTENTVHAVRNAFNTLRRDGHVRPDPKRVVFAGHSVGGILAPNLAARADGRFIPKPAAVFSLQPGISATRRNWWGVPLEDMRLIPASTLLVTCAGEHDRTTRDTDARRIYRAATNVPAANKSFLLYRTDRRGDPHLVADHRSPASLKAIVDDATPVGEPAKVDPDSARYRGFGRAVFDRIGAESIDALDTHGYWAVLDRMIEAAGSNDARLRAAALGATAGSRAMGKWSDGSLILPPRRIVP